MEAYNSMRCCKTKLEVDLEGNNVINVKIVPQVLAVSNKKLFNVFISH